jgi:hypothetical protein
MLLIESLRTSSLDTFLHPPRIKEKRKMIITEGKILLLNDVLFLMWLDFRLIVTILD